MLRKKKRRFVDEEFAPLLEDAQDRIERYRERDPEHAELTDNVRPQPMKLPEAVQVHLRETAQELGF